MQITGDEITIIYSFMDSSVAWAWDGLGISSDLSFFFEPDTISSIRNNKIAVCN